VISFNERAEISAKRKKKERKRNNIRLLTVTVVVFLITFIATNVWYAKGKTYSFYGEERYITVRVKAGDTLWGICKKYYTKDSGLTFDEYVSEQIDMYSGWNGEVDAGGEITIHVYIPKNMDNFSELYKKH